ncbi:MAG: 23S rRNA (adenine(2503)-C(2))-methyltransferase RlmN [Bacteroidia bacterium]
MQRKPNIRDLSLTELEAALATLGEPRFRARQIHQWLWQKGAATFADMSNLPKALRERLEEAYAIDKAQIEATQRSSDGTIKYAFRLAGGQMVEGVLIPTSSRVTACVSSQAGCSLDCKFCATGFLKLQHNLHHYEIFDQVQLLRVQAEAEYGRPLSNIVYMGMGEPLLNYRNVIRSVDMITGEDGLGMSPQRITVSTSGIAKMIRKLADDEVRFEFALSLHAADDETRSRIMPINDSNNLDALKEALVYFYEKTRTRVTYEYCIFRDVNDSLDHASRLVDFSRIIPSKVNVIEYNPVPESGFEHTTRQRMDAFIQYLESQGVIVNVRRSRGKDVDGGCGQLALKNWERK